MSDYYDSEKKDGTHADAADGASITWTNTMKAVFAPYVTCMLQSTGNAIDLSQYSNGDGTGVADNIGPIQQHIDSGAMPMNNGDGTDYVAIWAKANGKALFDQWYANNYPQ